MLFVRVNKEKYNNNITENIVIGLLPCLLHHTQTTTKHTTMNKIMIEVTRMFHLGAFLAIILLLLHRVPITRSFHIVNHHHPRNHRPRQQQQPQNCRMSFSNSRTRAHNNAISNSSPVVLHERYNIGGSTTQHYHKNNNNHDRRGRPFDNESLDDAYYREEEFSAIRMDENRKFESSMEHGWRGLNEIYSSPSIIGGGGCDNFMIIPNDELLVFQSKSLGVTTTSSSPLNLEEKLFNENDLDSETIAASSLPLILRPKDGQRSSPEFLRSFLEKNREWIEQQILKHGVVVFRGFGIESNYPENSINAAIREFIPGINNDEEDGFEFYFVSNIEGTSKSHFPFESVYPDLRLIASPNKQHVKPIYSGTTLTNFRKVYHDLPPRLRTKLLTKKLLYTRTVPATVPSLLARRYAIDDAARKKSWFQLFGTTNKRHTEQMYRQIRSYAIQKGRINDEDTFATEFLSEAFQLHPKTKEWIFFKHAHVFHWTTFPAELFRASRGTKNVNILGHALLVGIKSFWRYGIRRRKSMLPVQVTFGDGKPISIWEMHQIRKAVRKNMTDIQLQEGDLLIIDGHSMSIRDNI
jgi:hypothetical protein